MDELSHKKRSRVDSFDVVSESESDQFEFGSTKAKKMREQLLSLLDDSDTVPDRDPVSHNNDLDSVIRSFEEEISGSGSSSPAPDPVTIFDLETGSGEILPGVGELQGIGELWDFQDELLSYDPFRFGFDSNTDSVANVTGEVGDVENGKEYVSLDGIFDYSDENFGSDFSSWRYETLPAL